MNIKNSVRQSDQRPTRGGRDTWRRLREGGRGRKREVTTNFCETDELRLILIKDKHPIQLNATLFRGQLRGTTVPKDSSASFCSFRFVFLPLLLVFPVSFLFSSFLSTPSLIFRGICPRLFCAISNYPTKRRKLYKRTERRESRRYNGERSSRVEVAVARSVEKFQRKCTSKEMQLGLDFGRNNLRKVTSACSNDSCFFIASCSSFDLKLYT